MQWKSAIFCLQILYCCRLLKQPSSRSEVIISKIKYGEEAFSFRIIMYNFEIVYRYVVDYQSTRSKAAFRRIAIIVKLLEIVVFFLQFESNQTKFVIILTYHRAGSSFIGQLFNTNPNAFYLYEPLDALYQAMYGSADGWTVPTDITSFSDGSQRQVCTLPHSFSDE